MIWALPLAGVIVFEIISDIFAKEYSLKGSWILWVSAILGYIICNVFWLSALRNGSGLVRGGAIFSVTTAMASIILGLYIYHESLRTIQIVGVIIGVIALALIFWE